VLRRFIAGLTPLRQPSVLDWGSEIGTYRHFSNAKGFEYAFKKRYPDLNRGWGSPLSAFGLMTPYRARFAVALMVSAHKRPERALMKRLPESLSIALWLTGSCWVLAVLTYATGASTELIFPLFMLGLVTGIA
jgi:hypothetical protein